MPKKGPGDLSVGPSKKGPGSGVRRILIRRTIHMEVGPSVINRSRTIHMEGRRLKEFEKEYCGNLSAKGSDFI